MLLTKEVHVSMGGGSIKHYFSLGYKNLTIGKEILVPIEHLTKGSKVFVYVECDYCGRVIKKRFKAYNRERGGVVKKDSCASCAGKKTKESNMIAYGVESVMHVEEYIKARDEACIRKYGTKSPSSLPRIKEKVKKSWQRKTKSEKEIIKKKIEKTNMERYGVKCPLELKENRKKLFETLNRGSSQQKETYNIVSELGYDKVFYNFSYSKLSLDIYVEHDGYKINVEYDSSYWHNPKRDRKRDEFLKGRGIKIVRIKSGHRVPKKHQIKKAMEKIFSGYNYTEVVLSDWNKKTYEEENNE